MASREEVLDFNVRAGFSWKLTTDSLSRLD
jgi:hypothetical protein